MAFWVLSLLLFVAMMAVLDVLPVAMPVVADGAIDFSWLTTPVMAGCVLLFVLVWQIAKSLPAQSSAQLPAKLGKWIARFLLLILMLIMMAVAGTHTVLSHIRQVPSLPDYPATITATVSIDELSDSVYDPINGTAYRQKAVLTDIKPANYAHTTTNNPLYNHKRAALHSEQDFVYPDTLTVLLTANPIKNSKNNSLDKLNDLPIGTTATMTMELTPLYYQAGAGFDSYRWLVGRHIFANAKVLAIDDKTIKSKNSFNIQSLRQKFRQHFLKNWQQKSHDRQQSDAVALSLLTGDRALIDKGTKDLYQFAGISHLLAISGTHVLFLALILAGAITFLIERYAIGFYKILPRWQVRWLVMSVAALLYALFTGFDVPAVRTVYLLVAMGVARYLLLGVDSFKVLVIVGLVMAWLDPYVLWQAGFWLSFVAVALLMRYEMGESKKGLKAQAMSLVKLQAWLFVGMLPLSILIFGKVSLVGFFSNLFAVGLFGWVIVPLNMLAGMIYALLPSVADMLWSLVSMVLGATHTAFELLRLVSHEAWLRVPIGFGVLVLLFLAMMPFLLPRLMPRYLCLPMVCLSVFALGFAKNNDLPIYATLGNSQKVNAVLVKDETASWLILNSDNAHIRDMVLSDEIVMALQARQVRSLTGIIVQTPNRELQRTVGQLSQTLIIQHYWQAGRDRSRQGKLLPMACVAGQAWEQGGFGVQAVTGWSDVADETVHDCSVRITHSNGVFGAGGMAHLIMIDASRHERVWRLWQLLCQDDENKTTNETQTVDLWVGVMPKAFDGGDDTNFNKANTIKANKTLPYADAR